MTKFLATLLATFFLALAAAPAMAMSNAEKCGPDGPEVYKRPGGYCEQINAGSMGAESVSGHKQNLPEPTATAAL